ncbi:MAG: hypothetical protein JWM41_505 [Gemmatimonadetes bacterium]|nr:hypothetical protein [Gemmatimonadota bacterium]
MLSRRARNASSAARTSSTSSERCSARFLAATRLRYRTSSWLVGLHKPECVTLIDFSNSAGANPRASREPTQTSVGLYTTDVRIAVAPSPDGRHRRGRRTYCASHRISSCRSGSKRQSGLNSGCNNAKVAGTRSDPWTGVPYSKMNRIDERTRAYALRVRASSAMRRIAASMRSPPSE